MTIKAFFKQEIKRLLWTVLIVAACTATTMAQTPSTFTYQGRLTEAGLPANGAYDLQFALYDSTGARVGTALMREDVQVVNGVFTVTLDFGTEDFDGAARLLEIAVRPGASPDAFSTLAPRQPITSSPYALRSLNAGTAAIATTAETATTATNAAQLGGVDAGHYVLTNDPRLSDSRPPTEGSSLYVQNTTAPQPVSLNIRTLELSQDLSVAGSLSADSVNVQTEIFMNHRRMLRAPLSNVFLGFLAGVANTTGDFNTFVGEGAGFETATGDSNSFFGFSAGAFNNSGSSNSFFGKTAGVNNTTGNRNSLFGAFAADTLKTGSNNSVFGYEAGRTVESGSNNTLVGSHTDVTDSTLSYATAIGAGAVVNTSHTVVLGKQAGIYQDDSGNAVQLPADSVLIPGDVRVVHNARIEGDLNVTGNFSANSMTNINATNITSGTLDTARLSTVPVAKGGTGLTSVGTNGSFLRSNGTSWISAPLSLADVLAGSVNYIQNTTTAQAGNFNIAGNGTAGGTLSGNLVSAVTQFNIGSQRVFSTVGTDSFGKLNTNVFAGVRAGASNTTGTYNSVLGYDAGNKNTTGIGNSFVGNGAGQSNTTGHYNSFFGTSAGYGLISGGGNSGFGHGAGASLYTGTNNTFIGADSRPMIPDISNATAIGWNAQVSQSNSLILGSEVNVGIGTSAPTERLTVKTATNSYGIIHTDNTITIGTFVGGAGNGGYMGTKSNHPLHLFANDGPASLTIDTTGRVRIVNLGSAGSTQLCRNATNQISNCSSSLRYKTDLHAFTPGLDIVRRLRPISFRWKETGALDVGFGAEDVAAIEPLLVTSNDAGVVEGVKYDRMSVALVNAVREQQTQIEQQNAEIKRLQMLLTNLQKIVCVNNATAQVCK